MMAIRLMFVTPLVLLLITVAFYTSKWGLAEAYSDPGFDAIKTWSNRDNLNEESWQIAYESTRQALRLNPYNPTYHQRLSRLYRLHELQGYNILEPDPGHSKAFSHLRQALETRPNFAFSWAELALLKSDINQVDEEFNKALQNAMRLGPWDREVLEYVTPLGLFWYNDLDEKTRTEFDVSMSRALRSPLIPVSRHAIRNADLYPHLKPRWVETTYPKLIDRSWPKTARTVYLSVSNWMWAELDVARQAEISDKVLKEFRDVEDFNRVLDRLRQPGFRKMVCSAYYEGEERARNCP